MAATRLIALHKNKGKSVAACLKSRTDYAQNPEKTEQGELVSSYECSPLTVDEEFMLSKRQYELATGRRQKSDVIAYQIRQSFKPGEITAEEANKVGYELAMRFTKGKYAFIVATHTDREHMALLNRWLLLFEFSFFLKNVCWLWPAWEMKLRRLPAEEMEGVMYYDPAATGERIQTLRKNREVTQEQLAIGLNISDRYMRNPHLHHRL